MKTASILGVHFHAVTLQQAVELAMSRLSAALREGARRAALR